MKGKYAFASYSHQDANSAMQIVEALLDHGFQIWIDRIQLVAGEEWSKAISDALRGAKVLLWFAGRNTNTSSWMQQELRSAMNSGEQAIIIPVLVEGAEPEKLPPFLQNRQWIDAREDRKSAIDELEKALERYLGSPAPPTEKATAQNSGYVFISYSVEDRAFLEDLKGFLKEKGYGYWDFHESKRDYQTQFHLELESIIRDSRAVLCIVTPSWKKSRWAPREYLFTEDIRKPIFLLRAEILEPTLLIAGSSYIDFVNDKDRAFSELDRELAKAGL
jgi:hypothetical protein